jgi:peptidyl-prolyl isomerase D
LVPSQSFLSPWILADEIGNSKLATLLSHSINTRKHSDTLTYTPFYTMTPQPSKSRLSEQRRSFLSDSEPELIYRRLPLLTNASLAALKCSPPAGSLAVSLSSRALNVTPLSAAEKGKALYRRAQGKIITKDDEGAEKDLKESLENVPGDAGVLKALKDVETRRKERKEKEKRAYAKMFA